jgi:hypothetical protein
MSVEGTGRASCVKIAALGDDSRVRSRVAQLDTQIETLATSKTFMRYATARIVKLPSCGLNTSLSRINSRLHILVCDAC